MCYVSNYARPLLRVDINWAMSTKIVKIKNDDGRYTHSYYIVLSHHVQIVFTPNFKVILKYDPQWKYKKCRIYFLSHAFTHLSNNIFVCYFRKYDLQIWCKDKAIFL